ncbi:unnamed protein product [Oikopleura dioica]|uniref:Superoxide dismutase copper/zinc binding domain-containing protein n=1 Tax=Oikopleura dioica TaxID=34765 RepID=E4WUD1_OIKDI|nr:unnamed protein product [Oikopleura dioica]
MKIFRLLPIFTAANSPASCEFGPEYSTFGTTETGDGFNCPEFSGVGKVRCKYECGEGRIQTFKKFFAEYKCTKNGNIKFKKEKVKPIGGNLETLCIPNNCHAKKQSQEIGGGFLKKPNFFETCGILYYDVKCENGDRYKKAAACDPRTGEFTNQEYFKNLCDNFGTEKYRCDFVAGQARVNGTINLEEIWMNGQRGVHLTGIISSPDRLFVDGEHGFHVHASNDPSDKCAATGGHFSSAPDQIHGPPTNDLPDRHAGDLGNIFVNDGAAIINIFDRIASLDESSPEFIGNRGIVLHALRDDGNPERDPTSTGAAGARLACCSIVKKN